MSKSRRETIIGPCAYCGEVKALEDEHVVPRALFIDANQATVTIPSCHECNNTKSAGEGHLRDLMALKKRGSEHPVARALMPRIADAARKGLSPIGLAAANVRLEPHITKSGLYLSHEYQADIDHDALILQTLRFMTRGLHFHELGKPVLPDTPHDVLIIPDERFEAARHQFLSYTHVEPRILGNNVFWWTAIAPDGKGNYGWVMCFYGGELVVGVTGGSFRPDDEPIPKHRTKKGKGKREKRLKDVIDRGLVVTPPDNYLDFLHAASCRNDK